MARACILTCNGCFWVERFRRVGEVMDEPGITTSGMVFGRWTGAWCWSRERKRPGFVGRAWVLGVLLFHLGSLGWVFRVKGWAREGWAGLGVGVLVGSGFALRFGDGGAGHFPCVPAFVAGIEPPLAMRGQEQVARPKRLQQFGGGGD